jgi:elongation factor P
MVMIPVSSLKKGMTIIRDNEPHVVMEVQFINLGRGQAVYKCKLKNLISRSIFSVTYRSGEKLEEAQVETRHLQFLYQEGDQYYFMDNQSYEQLYISAEILGDDALFLSDNLEVEVLLWGERPIGITLPTSIEAQIAECEPGLKGDTATAATKLATLATGAVVKVPLFVDKGDWVKIDTRTGSYMGRVGR